MEEKSKKSQTTQKPRVRKPATSASVKRASSAKVLKTQTTKGKEYERALGRRKTATAVAKLFKSKKEIKINGLTLNDYFPRYDFQKIVQEPLKVADLLGKVGIEITTKGGGKRGQAEASRLAIARVLLKEKSELRTPLKLKGLFSRDARQKERKKFGLKKARRAPQWQKR